MKISAKKTPFVLDGEQIGAYLTDNGLVVYQAFGLWHVGLAAENSHNARLTSRKLRSDIYALVERVSLYQFGKTKDFVLDTTGKYDGVQFLMTGVGIASKPPLAMTLEKGWAKTVAVDEQFVRLVDEEGVIYYKYEANSDGSAQMFGEALSYVSEKSPCLPRCVPPAVAVLSELRNGFINDDLWRDRTTEAYLELAKDQFRNHTTFSYGRKYIRRAIYLLEASLRKP